MIQARNNIKVFVSSTVYGFQDVLDNVYTMLDTMGYDVLMSHKGTIPLDSKLSNLENCLRAVGNSDVFVGFIRPLRGSGVLDEDDLSITEYEFNKAYELDIPRFILVDSTIPYTRDLFRWLDLKADALKFTKQQAKEDGTTVVLKNHVMHSTALDMYNMAIKNNEPPKQRVGNWVQAYRNADDIRLHLENQFQYVQWIQKLIQHGK